jgi:two-component system, LytTR family, sensor kinase
MLIINYWTARFSIFKEPVKLLVFQFVMLAGFVFIIIKCEIIALKWARGEELPKMAQNELMTISLLITFLISSIYASVGFFIQWKKNLVKAKSLEKANLEAQFETLKTQVNPHFLFNSLNTLLSIVEGNAEAEQYIENLSEFMRYILKHRDTNGVLLNEELEVARQYAFLQQSRFNNKLQVHIDVPTKYDSYFIPPLTIQMLIENAIKHNEISNEKKLNISIFVDHDQNLVVENNLNKRMDEEISTGIGLKNIQSRYQFLIGKDIDFKETDGKFIVLLPLIPSSK